MYSRTRHSRRLSLTFLIKDLIGNPESLHLFFVAARIPGQARDMHYHAVFSWQDKP